MHKSRLSTIVIDCEVDDLDGATDWWGRALGLTVHGGDEKYRGFNTPPSQPKVLIQKVAHPSRVHLDIEADDVEAEVARLEKLGAVKVEKIKRWWVMQAPTGHRFCVVPPQREDFDTAANVWHDA